MWIVATGAMDPDLTLPLLGGALLILVIVAGSIVVLMRPSDTPKPPESR